MHRNPIFATIASLLLIPFAFAASLNPITGKSVADNGLNAGSVNNGLLDDAETTSVTLVATSTQTNSCKLPKIIPLSTEAPVLDVNVVNNDGSISPLRLAIVLGSRDNLLFSQEFCIRELNRPSCYNPETPTQSFLDKDLELVISNHALKIKIDDSTTLENFEFKIVENFRPEDQVAREQFKTRYGDVDGVIGLNRDSDFVQLISSLCNIEPSFGIHLTPGSSLVFGGLDTAGNSIINGGNILGGRSDNTYTNTEIAFQEILNGRPEKKPLENKVVVFDSIAPRNVLPSWIPETYSGAESVFLTFQNSTTFTLPWSSFGAVDVSATYDDDSFLLGKPFFEYVYVALFPGDDSLSYAPNTASTKPNFQLFPTLIPAAPSSKPTASSGPATTITAGSDVPNDEDSPATSPSSKPNIGAIVGGVVGGVAFLIIIVLSACFLIRRRKLTRQSSLKVEKEYEADFDAETGHDVCILNFSKETGYASIPTPPPPPKPFQESPYHVSSEYVPGIQVYSDETPARSQNSSPAYTNPDNAPISPQEREDRRLSAALSISTEAPSPMISRNVSAVTRRDYPSISQVQNRSVLPEDDDEDDDVVSMRSGPTYQPVIASAPPPRLPFARTDSERSDAL